MLGLGLKFYQEITRPPQWLPLHQQSSHSHLHSLTALMSLSEMTFSALLISLFVHFFGGAFVKHCLLTLCALLFSFSVLLSIFGNFNFYSFYLV